MHILIHEYIDVFRVHYGLSVVGGFLLSAAGASVGACGRGRAVGRLAEGTLRLGGCTGEHERVEWTRHKWSYHGLVGSFDRAQ